VNRYYVVHLQHRVRELEEELDRVENEDAVDDPDALMRAAAVRVSDTKESKYLGPSSGIAITRLVMQLAKQFTDSSSIKDIVDENRAAQIKDLYTQEQAKPYSKIFPLISNVAAEDLPKRGVTDGLVQLYKLKVQPMYPALHEPTLERDIDAVYADAAAATDYQHFICRMVIAVSLQKADAKFAGLADSYYLAALKYLDAVVRPKDLRTLQCFALMAEYSLLTPTRTAIYYVVGLAVRLTQALGLHEEKTVVRARKDGTIDVLEVDMRRRVFWCILAMDYGLAHSLGRPAIMATSQNHIDVGWFHTCDDKYITPDGIDPAAPQVTLKKWIAIHFFKMRMHQLEIRRKLYMKKQDEPKDDNDPWFIQMDKKITEWRDASPSQDEGQGLDKVWFIGRYNTMVVFMYRPSPQVPRPSLQAAFKCYDACEYNIYMHREQIDKKNVDLTWVFTQSLFMAINTMLWSLSYVEVRRKHRKEDVQRHLEVAMAAIGLASLRWPGVASAVQLYYNLINAVLKIYEKDGDVPVSATTPSESTASPSAMIREGSSKTHSSAQMTSPGSTGSVINLATPEHQPGQQQQQQKLPPPFGYMHQAARRSVEMPPPLPYASQASEAQQTVATPPSYHTPASLSSVLTPSSSNSYDPSNSSDSPYLHYDSRAGSLPPLQNFQLHPLQPQQQPYQAPNPPTEALSQGYHSSINQSTGPPSFDTSALSGHADSSWLSQPNLSYQGGLGSWPAAFDPVNVLYPFSNELRESLTQPNHLSALQQQQQHAQHQQQQSFIPQDWANLMHIATTSAPGASNFYTHNTATAPAANPFYMSPYDDPSYYTNGLTLSQQEELMQSLETDGMEDIQHMISATLGSMSSAPQQNVSPSQMTA
jgi:hypothetical protein